ncbi:GNAT family N-acetyltransferase [Alkalinema sp. FACHB-956]|uniref:GNAT family N-acetyltransferase n=1 Tax=Alkalinema sp. FACHB-956 TaxID=2692768 RepID=UPI001685704F|nr:GNAT family N-acetyltransferase [Alkalinema sp. FACHB-956]MBD2329233.1 GNAT family N-acetyltransferase [Alkalinema sp. FACHB-956]
MHTISDHPGVLDSEFPSQKIPFILRPYQSQDAPAVVDLWHRTWHQTFPDLQHPQSYAGWQTKFQQELLAQAVIWVATIAEQANNLINDPINDPINDSIGNLMGTPVSNSIGNPTGDPIGDQLHHQTIGIPQQAASDRIIGFVAVVLETQFVDQLFVDSRYHNQGIGAALLNRAKQLCPQGLTLDTLQINLKARKFYEHHGFKPGQLSVNAFNGQPNVKYHWQP